VIFATIDYLREVGLSREDIKVKISSRKLLAAFLKSLGIPKERLEPIFAVLDKKSRVPPDTFSQMLDEQIPDKDKIRKILEFMSLTSIPELDDFIKLPDEEFYAYNEIKILFTNLSFMGVGDFCVFDPTIVRGLAYYTGIVFEVHDVTDNLRAICGGGRFDNLLRDFGGPLIPATGMGMGDCVLEILLREKGLFDKKVSKRELEYFVALADRVFSKRVYEITAELRRRNFSANFSYKPLSGLAKQLKEASTQNAKKCIIVGSEIENDQLVVKNMATGEQELVDYDEFWSRLGRQPG